MARALSCRVGRCASSGAATLVPHCARCTASSCSTCGADHRHVSSPCIATSAAPSSRLRAESDEHHPWLTACRADHSDPTVWTIPGPDGKPEQSHTAPAVQCCRTLLHAPIRGCGCVKCINDKRVAVRCGGQPGGSRLSDDVLLEAGGSEGGLADAQRCVKVRSLSRSRLRSQQLAIEKRKRQSLMQRRVKDTRDD